MTVTSYSKNVVNVDGDKALYKDAMVWEERFKNSIEMLAPKKAGRIVPRRRWL